MVREKKVPPPEVEVDLTAFREDLIRILRDGGPRTLALFFEENPGLSPNEIYKSDKDLYRIFCKGVANSLITDLVKFGLDPSLKDKAGNCLIEIAINCRDKSMLRDLLKSGANPNLTDSEGKSMLYVALEHALLPREIGFIELLLLYGAKDAEVLSKEDAKMENKKELAIKLREKFWASRKE